MSSAPAPAPGAAEELLASLRHAYRLVEPAEWAAAQASGLYTGTALDAKDAFMHLSLPGEVLTTARLYYGAHAGPLLVLQVDLQAVPGARLRADWVAQRSAFFPHIVDGQHGYHFPAAAVTKVTEIRPLGDGTGAWSGFAEQ
jgi:uncharacterized protein (DUF952 family)